MAAAANARTIVDQWLGTGLRFPLQPREGNGRIELVSGMELVRQSIETILDTDPGERVMQPLFGCGLQRYLMAPNTMRHRTAIRQDITEALALWEPRVRVSDVSVTPGEDPR